MTNPLPDLMVGDVVVIEDYPLVRCCRRSGYESGECCGIPVQEEQCYQYPVCNQEDIEGWKDHPDVLSITRAGVVIWERER